MYYNLLKTAERRGQERRRRTRCAGRWFQERTYSSDAGRGMARFLTFPALVYIPTCYFFCAAYFYWFNLTGGIFCAMMIRLLYMPAQTWHGMAVARLKGTVQPLTGILLQRATYRRQNNIWFGAVRSDSTGVLLNCAFLTGRSPF